MINQTAAYIVGQITGRQIPGTTTDNTPKHTETRGVKLTDEMKNAAMNAYYASEANGPVDRVFAALTAALATQPDRVAEMEARKDAAYLERNQVVAALASVFPSGTARTAIEGWSDDWHGCVYIDLPTGQVSWHYHDSQAHLFAHLPPYQGSWDGHDTEEKYRRALALRGQPDRYAAGFERAREMAIKATEFVAKLQAERCVSSIRSMKMPDE